MNKMRILHLRKSEGFYGAERVVLAIAKGSEDHGSDSWIGCINDSRNPCPALFEVAVRQGLPAVLLPCSMRFDPFCLREIVKTARSLKINVIHCHGFKADFYGFFAALWLGIPAISTQHGWTRSNRLIRAWERADLVLLRRFSKVVAVSEEIELALAERGVPSRIVEHIPNGISIPPLRKKSETFLTSLGASWNTPLIGIIGRLSVEKGHRDFLSAVKRVQQTRPAARFWIVGSGTLRDDLMAYADTLGIGGVVRFLDFRNDMETVYSHLDVVVSASLREGVPIALLEAMALGRPVIATKVGGIPSFILDGINGILVPPQNPEILADRILDLLDHPSKRQELGLRARRTVTDHFSADRMNAEYYRVYRNFFEGR